MCESTRPAEDEFGIVIYASQEVDAVIQRARIQRGYTLVIWRGRHVTEPYELTPEESFSYWQAVQKVGKALADYYQPLKMNYETLGNTVPHLHTHLLPRFVQDPAPGRPFPLLPQDGSEARIDDAALRVDADALRAALRD
ncbi:HIT family protein [Actinoplanes awajinensis]|uniref:HIT family protein n=1 Tax=Actinoplanes awajinensis TaxID=135946 RepID=UPI0009FF0128